MVSVPSFRRAFPHPTIESRSHRWYFRSNRHSFSADDHSREQTPNSGDGITFRWASWAFSLGSKREANILPDPLGLNLWRIHYR
jgi:hypothetical protein